MDFKNPDILAAEALDGRQLGFTGKQAIHPSQILSIQEAFSPSLAEIQRAQAIVKNYEEHEKRGLGAFEMYGKMIDKPVVKWAQRLLVLAEVRFPECDISSKP